MNRRYPSLWARIMANSKPLPNGCWEWTGQLSTSGKYPQMSIRVAGRHKTVRVHRLVGEIVLGRPLHPTLETIEHKCVFTRCVCPNCFLLATVSDNSKSRQNRHRKREDDAMARMVPLLDANIRLGRFAHYAEPIPF